MKLFIFSFLCVIILPGCSTIQHADQQAGYSYRTEIRQRNATARSKSSGSDAVRMAAVQGIQTVTVSQLPKNNKSSSSCPDFKEQEDEFKRLCEDHTGGSGDIDIDREAVCAPLRATIDKLRDICTKGGDSEQTDVVFESPAPPSAGVHINLTGANTGDIRLIIKSPGAADQSVVNGADDKAAPPPVSVVTGMTNGIFDLIGKATPWVAGGYALGNMADAFGDGLRNAGDRDNSVDDSINIDQSIGGNKIDYPDEIVNPLEE